MKTKPNYIIRTLLLLCIFYGQVGYTQNFTYKSKINAITKNTFYKVVLSSELSAHSCNHLEDLRIIDNAGKEIPYLLTKESSYEPDTHSYHLYPGTRESIRQSLRIMKSLGEEPSIL